MSDWHSHEEEGGCMQRPHKAVGDTGRVLSVCVKLFLQRVGGSSVPRVVAVVVVAEPSTSRLGLATAAPW